MITYTPAELREAIELAKKAKNTDDLPPYVLARIAKILAEELERQMAETALKPKELRQLLDEINRLNTWMVIIANGDPGSHTLQHIAQYALKGFHFLDLEKELDEYNRRALEGNRE